MWSEIVKKKEEVLAGEKAGEKDKPDSQETLSRLRLAMTQRLAECEQIELREGIDSPVLDTDMMELEGEGNEEGESNDTEVEEGVGADGKERGRGKKKREWKERPGAGMSAGKHQRLAQDQDENLLRALEVQDEKAGKLYQETLTAGIDKLVDAIANASQPTPTTVFGGDTRHDESAEQRREERLTEHEKKLNELMEAQKKVQQKLEDSVREQAEAEKRSEDRQEKMMELLQLLANKSM